MSSSGSSDNDQEGNIQLVPVFCTAPIPAEILTEFITSSLFGLDNGGTIAPSILSTTNVKSIIPSSRPPMQSFESPFLRWSIDQICEFFRAIVRPLVDELSGDWTVHTFVVLDERTVSDRTCWLCCDAPDFLEGDRVVLKKIRSDFLSVLPETMCYETFSKCPSESGNGRLMETGEVLCEKTRRQAEEEGQLILSIMPRAFDSSQRRAVISYGLTNDTKGKARRDSKTPE